MFHLSARLAWHMDGWNGRICKNPASNTYCVGPHSYPGNMIAENREIDWEEENKGSPCYKTDKIPPCIYSINAFGSDSLTAYADPPDFFMTIPPSGNGNYLRPRFVFGHMKKCILMKCAGKVGGTIMRNVMYRLGIILTNWCKIAA